ncbi:MAG TPA: RsmE family RNA methyltransferase [Desulfotignum sp.]|nr:RsmE family RNA methyltransferase [Desulfotignum sp.]
MQKFFIPQNQITQNQAEIQGQDARHIHRVLRLAKGDMVNFTDGQGTDFTGRISDAESDQVCLEIIKTQVSRSESPLPFTVCTGMLKHQKMDEIIKGLTQIGITQWVPFFCERSIPFPDAKALARRMKRWQTIAAETIKQCRRSRLVTITSPKTFGEVLELATDFDHCIAFWEKSRHPLSLLYPLEGAKRTILLTGPEGGFSDAEMEKASASGFVSYSLGPRILRAETAALCGAALIQHRLGDM